MPKAAALGLPRRVWLVTVSLLSLQHNDAPWGWLLLQPVATQEQVCALTVLQCLYSQLLIPVIGG